MANTKNTKSMDILRRRNAQLSEQLKQTENLQKSYEQIKHLNKEYEKHDPDYGDRRVSELIAELEDIRQEWTKALEELNRERDEYKELIQDMKMFRGIFEV